MTTITIEPELTRCVHTATREIYKDKLGKLLDGEIKSRQLQNEITMLTAMLEQLDFTLLRKESEKYLLQGKRVKFVFHMKNNSLQYEMQVLDNGKYRPANRRR